MTLFDVGSQPVTTTDDVIQERRREFGPGFVTSRREAEAQATTLINAHLGTFTYEQGTLLGQLFNTHAKQGVLRKDRFQPAFSGAAMYKVLGDLERFNEVLTELWTAPIEEAVTKVGEMLGDHTILRGAGASFPSVVLYLRDPTRFGVCIQATRKGLAAALSCSPFGEKSKDDYLRFCEALIEWREANDVAPQEADAILSEITRRVGKAAAAQSPFVLAQSPFVFLSDLSRADDPEIYLHEHRARYRSELRVPFVDLLYRLAEEHLRELDPKLDTTVESSRVLADVELPVPPSSAARQAAGFSRGRRQSDASLEVWLEPTGLGVGIELRNAEPDGIGRLRTALAADVDNRLIAALHEVGQPPEWQDSDSVPTSAEAVDWLDAGGRRISWFLDRDNPLLAAPALPDRLGALLRALHGFAAIVWGDGPDEGDDHDSNETGPAVGRLTLEQVGDHCHLPVERIEEWVAAVSGPLRQAYFYGPPGTGKTFVARQLALHLASSPSHVQLVQFHPAYSYEDFIEGLRPTVSGQNGALSYAVRPGIFTEFCRRARRVHDETFVFIVDEMNRADLAAVFGELLFLLEYRGDHTVTLPYSQEQFSVPRNVVLLGTMNTADRSLAQLDFALRRRFTAIELIPDREVLHRWLQHHSAVDHDLPLALFELVTTTVGDNGVAPGHSYWMGEGSPTALLQVWQYRIRPYLAEYWFEQPEQLARLDTEVRALVAEQS